MEEFFAALRSNPQQQVDLVRSKEAWLGSLGSTLDMVIGSLALPDESFALAMCLHIKISQSPTLPVEQVFTTCTHITNLFLAGDISSCLAIHEKKVYDLCDFLATETIRLKCPLMAVRPLYNVAACLPGSITTAHKLCLQMAVLAKLYSFASQVVDWNPTCVTSSIDTENVLCYFFYSAIALIGCKRYSDALFSLELAMSVPAQALSCIMLESYKKFVLVSLLHEGQVRSPPKALKTAVLRQIKTACEAYVELGTAFAEDSVIRLQTSLEQHKDLFSADKNGSLANNLLTAHTHRNILKLTRTFVTLSLADIAERVHLESAERAEAIVLNMIAEGKVNASISQRDGMVSFFDSEPEHSTAQSALKLKACIEKCARLTESMRSVDTSIITSARFNDKVVNGGQKFQPEDDYFNN